MSRIRSLHPQIFTDDNYMGLSFPARELIKGLWCEADDQGVFAWKPLTLKARILPCDAVDVPALLDELLAGTFIRRFEIAGRIYGAVRNFLRWQRPRRPQICYPLPAELRACVGLAPDEATAGRIFSTPSQKDFSEVTAFPPDPSQPPRHRTLSGIGAQMEDGGCIRRKKEDTHTESPKPREAAAPSGAAECVYDLELLKQEFAELWPLFPRRDDYKRAFAAYRIARRSASAAIIRGGVLNLVDEMQGVPRRYIPMPSTWLAGERWLDEASDRHGGSAEASSPEYAYLPESDDYWRDQLRIWFNEPRGGPTRDRWIDAAWGPAPGERGCRVPVHVLAGLGWAGAAA